MSKSVKKEVQIEINGVSHSVTVRRSKKAKRVLLHVHLTGQIEVVLPWYASAIQAERFLHDRIPWLTQVLEKNAKKREQRKVIQLVDGTHLPLFADTYTLRLDIDKHRRRTSYSEVNGIVTIRVAALRQIPDLVMKWYKERSRDFFVGRSIQLAQQLGAEVQSIAVRDTKSQWGSCHKAKKALSFHWKLALMPKEVADYVVAHEVAHLVQANHSKKFWQIVQDLDPQFRSHRTWLKKHGHFVEFSI